MALEIMTDERVRSVEWKDLMELSTWEVVRELLIFVPWLATSLFFAYLAGSTGQIAWYLPAMACSFMLFLVGLRQVHNAYHYALGISKPLTEWVIYFNSVLLLGSMHAVKFNHLRHHKHCMDDDDVEALSARMPGWKALLLGPYFPIMLHWTALTKGNRRVKSWVIFELVSNLVLIGCIFFVFNLAFLKYHIIVMAVGQCFTGFFAVWTVHHDCDRHHFIARTLRTKWKNFVSYNMFYHVEHHLYPKVPTCHLPELARRLDEKAPELNQKRVF